MSLSMAVGSPALITYSLTLTILNRIWIRRIFGSLLKKVERLPAECRHELRERLRAAQYLLQESQQVSMRASQVDGWLSSLIVLKENHAWWMRARKDLENTRRGYTFSLFAQIGMAFLAYTLTIAISLNSAPLGSGIGDGVLLTAGGGIWIWMIPVILGWIMCGTQARASSITDAINDKTHPVFRVDEKGKIVECDGGQDGISCRSGLVPRPRSFESISTSHYTALNRAENVSGSGEGSGARYQQEATEGEGGNEISEVDGCTTNGTATDGSFDEKRDTTGVKHYEFTDQRSERRPIGAFIFDYEDLKLPSWLGLSIEGDEALEGPIFNYARLFTFREFSSTVAKAFAANIRSVQTGVNQRKNSVDVAASCQLDKVDLQAYTPWPKIESNVWHQILVAVVVAIFVQWGTVSITFTSLFAFTNRVQTGPAIMIAYLTPTVGLGCRSGGYLIYGVLATISWAFILCSSLMSHEVSLLDQDIYLGRRKFVPRKENSDRQDNCEIGQMSPMLKDRFDQESDPANLSAHRRSRFHSTLAFLTVATRITGKLIATANGFWIVISAIFEYTGVYSTCWCAADADVLGSRAWAVLFATDQSFQTVARNYWIGGVIFSFAVCLVSYVGFFLACKRSDVDEYDG